jgi:hypothetical protein
VSYQAKKLGARERGPRLSYDWPAIPAYYDTGADLTACRLRFGFSRAAWGKAIERGVIRPRDAPRGSLSFSAVSGDERTSRCG